MQADAITCFLLGQLTIRSQLLTQGKETIWQGFHEHFLSVQDVFKPNLLGTILTWWCVAGNHWVSSWWKIYHFVFHFSSVQCSHSAVSDSLQPHGLQHTRHPCPSPTPRDFSNSCSSSQWCHSTISSSVVPLSCYL